MFGAPLVSSFCVYSAHLGNCDFNRGMEVCRFDTWQNLEASLFVNPGNANSSRLPNGFPHPSPATWPAPAPVPQSVSPPFRSLCPSLSFWVYCRPGVRDIGTAPIRLLVVVLCGQQMPNKRPSMQQHASTQTSNSCKSPIEHQMSIKHWFIKGNFHPKIIFRHHLPLSF